MKKFFIKKIIITVIFILLLSTNVFGHIITAPIDSRPVSLDYLKVLGELNGETFFSPHKDILDMFPTNANYNRFAKSDQVRAKIREEVAKNNNEETTVIINTSSYMTAGLVGSRCGENYIDFQIALDELESLVTEYSNPKYYINLSMPRTLPETRLNTIWRDEKKYLGLGHYYLKYNKNCEEKEYIVSKFSRVTPTQLIMEWSYITNKRYELGENSLEKWEKDFINHFDRVYRYVEPYKSYLSKYIMPFSSVSEISSRLMNLQDEGKIDEIIINNDDFQIPDFITHLNKTGANWIPKENGTPIKFSFARNYSTNGPRCVYKLIKDRRGVYEAERALKGKSKNINFIFGTDELPQLIYARNLSRRTNLSIDFNVISTNNESDEVAQFDVLKINSLVKNDLNFICVGEKKTNTKLDIYVFDYNNKNISPMQILKQMNQSKNEGRDVGLIEIFNSDTYTSGNQLFKSLLENSKNKSKDIGITELACYSAWNTNANAIGLGTAHAQVYGITKETTENPEAFLKAHLNLLAIHCGEDGFYTVQGKRLLTNERFVPVYEDTLKSEKLFNFIGKDEILSAFNGANYLLKENNYIIKNFNISDYNFPWGRLFECYLGFSMDIEKN